MSKNRDLFIKEQSKIESYFPQFALLNRDKNMALDGDLGFLANSLEYIDQVLHKPMYEFQWYKALPYIYAGGAMEYASFYKTNYSITNDNAYASGSNNVLITAKAQFNKETTRVQAFSYILEVGFIDEMKADKIGYNIFDQYDTAIALQHNRMMDQITFFGFPNIGDSYGLVNIPTDIITPKVSQTKWEEMTATELFTEITTPMLDIIADTEYSYELLPNRVLLPLPLFGKLAKPMAIAGEGGSAVTTGVSLYRYLKDNLPSNYAGYASEVTLMPIRYLANAGTNGTGRIIIYRYSEEVMRGVMGMELTRGATMPNVGKQATQTSYVAFVGEPQLIRPSAIRYIDNAE